MTLSRDERKRLKVLEKKLGYSFKDVSRLKHALTHKSYANEMRLSSLDNNERLEFLGDAVMELAVSQLLMERFPEMPEGDLSKLRAAVVNEVQLTELAKAISLGDFLYLGRGEDFTGGREKPSLLSDCYEALLGAVYLDRGLPKVFALVSRHFKEALETVGKEGFAKDYKTRLQEKVQGKFKQVPRYELVSATGPDHKKTFEVNLFIESELYGVGKGPTKKRAEQEAAKEALEKL